MASFSITQKTTNGMSIVFDNPSWNRAFKKLKGQVANAMWEASGKTMSDVQDHTYRYLKGFEGMYPTLATMVANSLDYDRGTEVVKSEQVCIPHPTIPKAPTTLVLAYKKVQVQVTLSGKVVPAKVKQAVQSNTVGKSEL